MLARAPKTPKIYGQINASLALTHALSVIHLFNKGNK